MVRFLLLLFFVFQFIGLKGQTIQSGMSWLATNSVTTVTSPNYPTANCGNINYSINCSKPFKRSNNGAPYNNNCLIFPSDISITNTFLTMTITFNQPVNNLKIRFIDLDENVSGFNQPEESISQINPPPSSVTPLNLSVNPFFLVGGIVTPFDNVSTNNNNDASGWVNWNGTLSSVSFRYNRPGSAYALIIDSIYFDCPISCSLVADAGSNLTICDGNTETLDATHPNAVSYLWSTGATTSTISTADAGTYWVQISNGSCTDADTVIVTSSTIPNVNLGTDTTTCNNSSLNLISNQINGNFLWSTSATNNSITVTQSGTYWLEVTNSCGIDRDSVNVVFLSPPTLNLGIDTAICINTQYTLTALIPNSTYFWQDNSTNPTFVVSQVGNYGVTVNTGICSVTDSIFISILTPPTVSLGNDTTNCNNLITELTPIFSGGNASILWNDNSLDSTLIINNSGIYWVEINNQCGVNRDSISVTIETQPIIEFGNDTTICSNSPFTLNALTTNGTYTWQDNSSNPTFIVSQAGNYGVTVNTGICSVTDSIIISILTPPTVFLGNDTSNCDNLITEITPIFGGGNASILWNDNSFDSTLIVNTSGIYWVEVENQCAVVRDSINVTIEIPPVFDLGNDTTICENTTLVLDPSILNATYSWQNNAFQPTLSVNQAGVYWVDVSTGNCLVRDSIIILTQNAPIVNLGNDITLCNGTSTVLNAFYSGANYSWQDNSNSPTLTIDLPGTYWVDVSNICGTTRDTFVLTIQNHPQVNFSNDTTFCLDESISLSAFSQGANYLWQDNSTNSSFIVSQAGLYSVVVTVGACQVEHDFLVNVKMCNSEIEMPTIFTPNGDGINDNFTPVINTKIKNASIVIVNRWGNVIYSNSNLISGWDGTSNGNECSEGVYFWKIDFEDFNSLKFTEHGFLHLEK